MKSCLFLAGTVIALSTVITPRASIAALRYPPQTTILWNQNSNYGNSVYSDNFTSGSNGTIYNNSAADDFVVPAGQRWTVNEVDVTGTYAGSCVVNCGPTNEIITFYKNKGGLPGAVIGTAQTIGCTEGTAGSFSCYLSPAMKLKGGTRGKRYWLGFVANMDFAKTSAI